MAAICNKNQKQQTNKIIKKVNNIPYCNNKLKFKCNCSETQLKFYLVKLLLKLVQLIEIVKKLNLVLKQPSLLFSQRPLNKTKSTTIIKTKRTSNTTATTSKTTTKITSLTKT